MPTLALPSSMSSRVSGTLQGSRILLSNNHKHKDCPLGHDVFTQKYDQLDFSTCESTQTHQNTQTKTLTQTHTCKNTGPEVGLDWLEQLWEWGGVHSTGRSRSSADPNSRPKIVMAWTKLFILPWKINCSKITDYDSPFKNSFYHFA